MVQMKFECVCSVLAGNTQTRTHNLYLHSIKPCDMNFLNINRQLMRCKDMIQVTSTINIINCLQLHDVFQENMN
jgi:hypothetical protein